MKNMNQTQTRSLRKKVLSLILAVVMAVSLLPISAFASGNSTSTTDTTSDGYEYNIMFLDCGRKYYSVDSIKQIIDNASAAGFNYIQLAVGNDGLRFLLDDMSLTVNGTTYSSDKVSAAIHAGNEAYYNFNVDELTQSEMDTIIAYAASKGMGVIPCVNTPGHMDAILSAATSLTGKDCSYNGSARTIDVTNATAVAFTQALLQKYIDYFEGKGCQLFNMGADEYANDIYKSGSMGFGNLQSDGKYGSYVTYVNKLAAMIKNAGMKPMAFNDGIYFNNNTSGGKFDTDIIICYWSSGWPGYTPMSASNLASKGFKLINTHGDYYWVLGKGQCSASKASGFDVNTFQGSTISDPVGSMFCIWADYPGAETEASVISKTADTIAAFGKALPQIKKVETVESKTVTKDNVTVTAPGLTNLTVAATDAPAIDAAAEGKVVAYDVTPATASGSYKKNGTVTLPIPEGWDASRVRGFVQNEDGSITTVTGTPADGKFTFTVPHFSVLGIYELAANAVDKTENVTVVQGSESEAYLLSGNVTLADGTYTTDDGVASYTIKTTTVTTPSSATAADSIVSGNEYIIGNGEQWLALSSSSGITSVANKDQATKWTIEGNKTAGYTIKNGSSYLGYTSSGYNRSLTVSSKSTSWQWDGNGFNVKLYNYYSYYISYSSYGYNSGWTLSYNSGDANPYVLTPEKTTTTKTVVFTGLKAGETTSVIIGDTQYNVTVVDASLAKADPITVEYWITNQKVTGSDGAESKTISAASAYGENGVLFSKLVPATGTQDGKNDVFWKGTRLTSDNKQTEGKGVDKTTSGNDFTYIRYWNQQWSFSADGKSWTDFNSDDQVVAYYLQKTNVTDEITTKVVDWGEPQESYSGRNYVIVDYAVKYLSGGTRVPNSFPVAGKSIGFHCDSSDTNTVHTDSTGKLYRSIGMIKAEATDNYEVYMITLTPSEALTGSQCKDNSKITYNTTDAAAADNTVKSEEKVVWVDNESDLGEFTDPDTHFTSITGDISYKVGGEPVVPGLEIYNQHGMLVTYYVREKETADSLHVHYIDTTGSSSNEFYSYAINVHQNTTFDKGIGLNNPWKGDLKNGTVTNVADKEQTVSANLSTMPAIGASYKYSKYTCNKVERSENGKDVYLYYTFNNKVSFVVDFGLPLKINLSDLNASLANANVTSVKVEGMKFGTAAYADKVVTYTPTEAINAIDTLSVTVSGRITYTDEDGKEVTRDDTVSYMVDIIPATSVYYEDSFATFTNADKSTGVNKGTGNGYWVTDGTTQTSVNQALEALGGTTNTKNVYGYDPAYADSSKFSMGSATKVTVAADTYKEGKTQWPTATFTFKGTGFDVISLTDNTSGAIFVDVYKGTATSGDSVKSYAVNNYYSYKQNENGQWVVSKDGNNALYQIPVMKVSGLDYGEYTAVIRVAYSSFFDQTTKNEYNFWLDAIRVYDPMGKDNATYEQDNEGYPQYIKLHDSLVGGTATAKDGSVFIDGAAEATIAQYKNYGPNNEVYLAKGQAISFTVAENNDIATIQIGAKAPNGTANMTVNNTEAVNGGISTATEMYYKLDVQPGQQVTISNTGDGILSLTNLKITFNSKPTAPASLAALTTADQENAVAQVRALFAEPVEPFNPDRFDASWSRNVRKGETAKLTVKTSEDVEAITVNGETIDSFTERHERTGWGWWAKTVTYREFIYTTTADVTRDYTVCAVNAAGVRSEEKTATLTVRPSVRDWLHGIFGKWF